jgi:N-methylhydantoinase A
MDYRLSIDSGGTFTDGVLVDATGRALTAKAHTTPADPTVGTLDCIARLASAAGLAPEALLARTQTAILGTTMATNLVATKSGARMGTIATRGFRLRIAYPHVAKAQWKEGPEDMYDFRADPPEPLTPFHLMTEVTERLDFRGQILTPLDEADVRRAVRYLREQAVQSIAVMCLFSQLDPRHEQRIEQLIAEESPGTYVAISSRVLPVTGEVERWSTTMFSAYVAPAVIGYVSRIQTLLAGKGFKGQLLFMQSNGGTATPDVVIQNPAVLLLSGPAAGPSLGRALGAAHDSRNILSVDMGGTSFDVGVVHDGIVDTVKQQLIDGRRFSLPCVDVNAIGAGGGSIAYLDSTGRLRVGPKSAGAAPGPVCYDKGGTKPTVTDANVVLGYIDPDFFLGGETRLRKDLAEQAIKEQIGDPLQLPVLEAAAAIYDVINATMAGGTDLTFAKRGYDPRDFTLCAAGGAAAVHAVRIAEELGIRNLIIPKVGPIYCAYGMMYCDLKHDFQHSFYSDTQKVDLAAINGLFSSMESQARATLAREGVAPGDMRIAKSVEFRYYGQFRERVAPIDPGLITAATLQASIEAFHMAHEQTVGYCDRSYPTEILRLHLSGTASTSKPQTPTIPKANGARPTPKGTRRAYFSRHGLMDTPVYDGDRLRAEQTLAGPAIIEERFTTFVLPPGATARVDEYGNLIASPNRAGAES